MLRSLALATLFVTSAPASPLPPSPLPANPLPDVLPPGHHGVEHDVVLEWGDLGDDLRLVAFPCRGFGGVTEIQAGEPFSFSSKYGTLIWAVPTTANFPEDREAAAATTWARARVPVGEISSAPMADPLARVVTTVRVTDVRPDGIDFTVVGERRFDAAGNELDGSGTWLLLAIAAAGAVLLVVLASKARPASH